MSCNQSEGLRIHWNNSSFLETERVRRDLKPSFVQNQLHWGEKTEEIWCISSFKNQERGNCLHFLAFICQEKWAKISIKPLILLILLITLVACWILDKKSEFYWRKPYWRTDYKLEIFSFGWRRESLVSQISFEFLEEFLLGVNDICLISFFIWYIVCFTFESSGKFVTLDENLKKLVGIFCWNPWERSCDFSNFISKTLVVNWHILTPYILKHFNLSKHVSFYGEKLDFCG